MSQECRNLNRSMDIGAEERKRPDELWAPIALLCIAAIFTGKRDTEVNRKGRTRSQERSQMLSVATIDWWFRSRSCRLELDPFHVSKKSKTSPVDSPEKSRLSSKEEIPRRW